MNQLLLFDQSRQFLTLREASEWASHYLNRNITISNISYLIQYGRLKKYGSNGKPLVKIDDLKEYYHSSIKEDQWKKTLGDDLNWHLSFTEYKESERTKHVHRLHPYKGKFIPQLVAYFLDSHNDEFKKTVFFHEDDIVLDPFCGSGTTLVQANELGIHAIGIDISLFNAMMTNVKVEQHNFHLISEAIQRLTLRLEDFQKKRKNIAFEEALLTELGKFNSAYFPSPEYKIKLRKGEIKEKEYASQKEENFLHLYHALVEKYQIKIQKGNNNTFLDKWFLVPVREEIDFLCEEVKAIDNQEIMKVLAIILSRTIRSCRATTHADLVTLKEPVTTPYYCKKHGKICKPIFSISGWWKTYCTDTLNRLKKFDQLRTETYQICLIGDSRTIDIYEGTQKTNPALAEILSKQKIRGIFSSPPYVGLIDYHEQHAYAYELFGLERKDELEIGPLFNGQGKEAKESYVQGIADVLKNCKKYLQNDYDIFLVANDKFNLYPKIAAIAEIKIVNQFKRPVLYRAEKDRSAYAEIIFHLKEK